MQTAKPKDVVDIAPDIQGPMLDRWELSSQNVIFQRDVPTLRRFVPMRCSVSVDTVPGTKTSLNMINPFEVPHA